MPASALGGGPSARLATRGSTAARSKPSNRMICRAEHQAPVPAAASARPQRLVPSIGPSAAAPKPPAAAPPAAAAAAAAAAPTAAAPPPRAPAPAPAPLPTADHPIPPPDHPVLELMRQRLEEGSAPGRRSDGFKLGLVVEGGGMRGIVTGAMLMSLLESFDALPAFDAVYGASAGAINATYFLTGQPEGLDIYTDHLAPSERFLSLKRYWMGGGAPAMDLSYLLDEVMVETTPLDWHGVLASPIPLKVVASSLDTLRAEVLQDFKCPLDLRESLKASACVPEIAGAPRLHRGHRFVDAAVFEPIPVKSAVRDGCTHVLALCSRPASSGPAWGKAAKRTLTAAVKHIMLSPPYMRDAWRVEPRHSTHQGQPLEDLLLSMAGPGRATLDLSEDDDAHYAHVTGGVTGVTDGVTGGGPAGGSGGGGAAAAAAAVARAAARDMAGCGRADGVRAADGVGGSHILPLYPGSAASFAPVCTHVPTLQRGRQEGFDAVQRALLPALAPAAARR